MATRETMPEADIKAELWSQEGRNYKDGNKHKLAENRWEVSGTSWQSGSFFFKCSSPGVAVLG